MWEFWCGSCGMFGCFFFFFFFFSSSSFSFSLFFFNDTATTEIYTLSLHDALPISAISLRPFPISAL